jgi:hypothetical protein
MDLVRYWRREGQHLDAAKSISDTATVEYAERALETAAELLMLRERVRNAEISLAAYDEGQCSEYWLTYPTRMKG